MLVACVMGGDGIGTVQEHNQEFKWFYVGAHPLAKRGLVVGQGHGGSGSEIAVALGWMKEGFDAREEEEGVEVGERTCGLDGRQEN